MHKIPHKIPHATFSRFTRISLHADLTRTFLRGHSRGNSCGHFYADIFTRTFLREHFYADIFTRTFLREHFYADIPAEIPADIFTRTFPRKFLRTFLRGHFYADIFTRTFSHFTRYI